LKFVDKLGSTAFAPVKADINGNIAKLEKAHTANPVGARGKADQNILQPPLSSFLRGGTLF
jgi:hypothetical protein